jgi:hypothetical protein
VTRMPAKYARVTRPWISPRRAPGSCGPISVPPAGRDRAGCRRSR